MVPVTSKFIVASLAPGTRKIYAQAFLKLKVFALANFQGAWFPTPVATLATYVSHRLAQGKAVASVMSILSAVAFFHKLLGYTDPTAHFLLKRIILGATKLTKSCDSRAPVTLPMLKTLVLSCKQVTDSPYHCAMFKAMYTLMFHAFLRIGEVTQSPNVLQLQNIEVNTQGVTVTFVKFKHHKGPPVYLHIPPAHSMVCPCKQVTKFLKWRGNRPGPLFIFPDGNPIPPRYFSMQLNLSLNWGNLVNANIKPHSFRIGAATYAATQGFTSTQIRQMGRWNSNAFEKYIRIKAFSTS
jgi:site-specific recombinase XerD